MSSDAFNGLLTLRRHVEIAHHIPGRLRLRFTHRLVASLGRGKLAQLESLCHPEGVLRHYSLNSETGSILIEYDAVRIKPLLLTHLFSNDEDAAHQAFHQLVALLSQSE